MHHQRRLPNVSGAQVGATEPYRSDLQIMLMPPALSNAFAIAMKKRA
jgi:hypothetical protein